MAQTNNHDHDRQAIYYRMFRNNTKTRHPSHSKTMHRHGRTSRQHKGRILHYKPILHRFRHLPLHPISQTRCSKALQGSSRELEGFEVKLHRHTYLPPTIGPLTGLSLLATMPHTHADLKSRSPPHRIIDCRSKLGLNYGNFLCAGTTSEMKTKTKRKLIYYNTPFRYRLNACLRSCFCFWHMSSEGHPAAAMFRH